MHEVTVSEKGKTKTELKVGQFGRVSPNNPNYGGEIVLMNYDCVVSITSPGNTWEKDNTIDIELIPVGSTITIEVKK